MIKIVLNTCVCVFIIIVTACILTIKSDTKLNEQNSNIDSSSINNSRIYGAFESVDISEKCQNNDSSFDESMDSSHKITDENIQMDNSDTKPTKTTKTSNSTKITNDATIKQEPITKPSSTTAKVSVIATTIAPIATNPDNSANSYISEVLRLVNIERQKYGLNPVTTDNKITSAATVRAEELITQFSHVRPNGESCFTVLKEAGINYTLAGENIAAGQKTPQEVVTAWMNSEGHRENILNGGFTKMGVGYVTGGAYNHNWVQVFAKY